MKSTVRDIMTTQVVAVRGSTPFKEMAARLHRERVSAFPVVDDDGKVVGVVSETDLLPKETLDAGWAAGRPEMASRILCDDDQDKAESGTAATVTVDNGVVTVAGSPETAELGRAVVARARHVEGVVAVRDRLQYPPS